MLKNFPTDTKDFKCFDIKSLIQYILSIKHRITVYRIFKIETFARSFFITKV